MPSIAETWPGRVFDRIAAELVGVSHQDGGDLEVISGHHDNHDNHGTVVLIRDGTRFVVLTESASTPR